MGVAWKRDYGFIRTLQNLSHTCLSCLWCQFEETHALDCVCLPCSTKYKGSSANNSHISTKYQQFVEHDSYYTLCDSKPYLKREYTQQKNVNF